MNKIIGSLVKILFALILIFYPYIVSEDSFLMHTMIYIIFFGVVAAGLNLIMTTGQLSIGQAGFMALGAYTCVLLVTKFGWSFWLGWLIASVVAGIFAYLFGKITLRIKGVHFAILTFALGEVIYRIISNTDYFGGVSGIIGIPPPNPISIPGIGTISFQTATQYYYLVLLFCLSCIYVYYRIIHSQIGMVFKSIEKADLLAECCGINIMKYKLLAFVTGCVMAGSTGALYAHYFTYISPDSFHFVESIDFIIINMVGGVGTFAGPFVGAVFLISIPEFMRSLKEYEHIIYALCLIFVLYFLPQGITGTIYNSFLIRKDRN